MSGNDFKRFLIHMAVHRYKDDSMINENIFIDYRMCNLTKAHRVCDSYEQKILEIH